MTSLHGGATSAAGSGDTAVALVPKEKQQFATVVRPKPPDVPKPSPSRYCKISPGIKSPGGRV